MEENTQNSDVSNVEGSASPEPQSSPEAQPAPQGQEAQASVEKPTPFHEHPRFKELIEQNRGYRQQQETYARQLEEMREQMRSLQEANKATQKPKEPTYDQVLERLKQIDPEFAGFQAQIAQQMQAVPQLQQQLQQFQEWQQQQILQTVKTQAESRINQLYSEHKVPEELRSLYRSQIENMAYSNPKSSLNDLDNYFKQAHESISKLFEDVKRKERSSYVQDKKASQTPATATGGQPAGIPTGIDLKSSEGRIKAVADALRQGKQI